MQPDKKTKKTIADAISAHRKPIWDWMMEQSKKAPPPLYCSIDLRDSGHKIVPVDSNLFPAGFNNICPDDLRTTPNILRAHIESEVAHAGLPTPKKVLILPENHTSNGFYIENLYTLKQILLDAGFETEVGWYTKDASVSEPVKLVSASQKEVIAYPIHIEAGRLRAGHFDPDFILINNDFSSGYPDSLDTVKSQLLMPSYRLGWHTRKKSDHFMHYNRLAGEFAAIVGIDPWMIQIETEEVSPVNFNEDLGTEALIESVGRILDKTGKAYQERGIDRKPFVFVKNNSGTYGMGIMVVHSVDELKQMNRRTKNKMSTGKNKLPIGSVAIQEGVPTATLVDRLAAEPVIYLSGCELIGGFLRTNSERGEEDNLNSQGMVFRKLCMSDLRNFDPGEDPATAEPILELVYGTIARISALATGLELTSLRASK